MPIILRQYNCPCGKIFSGDHNKIALIIKLHCKKCKIPALDPSEINHVPITITKSSNVR